LDNLAFKQRPVRFCGLVCLWQGSTVMENHWKSWKNKFSWKVMENW